MIWCLLRRSLCLLPVVLLSLAGGGKLAWGQVYWAPASGCCVGGYVVPASPGFDWSRIDWDAAVRQGTRNAVVRGFNAQRSLSRSGADDWVRRQAAGDVTRYFNALGGGRSPYSAAELEHFQRLVEQGVEDAIVEGFNLAGQLLEKERLAAEAQAATAELALPEPTGEPRDVAFDSPEVRRHFDGSLTAKEFADRYLAARWVTAGWLRVLDDDNRQVAQGEQDKQLAYLPIQSGATGYLLLTPKRHTATREVWQHGKRLFRSAHYARYFEDAR